MGTGVRAHPSVRTHGPAPPRRGQPSRSAPPKSRSRYVPGAAGLNAIGRDGDGGLTPAGFFGEGLLPRVLLAGGPSAAAAPAALALALEEEALDDAALASSGRARVRRVGPVVAAPSLGAASAAELRLSELELAGSALG